MRSDMNKVVTERPRQGGSGRDVAYDRACKVRPKQRRFLDGRIEDDYRPKWESIRARHVFRYGNKEFSDLLGPLERWLKSQAGRPWDDVWSEVCRQFKGNGLQAAHIKDHVKSFVGGIPHSGQTYFKPGDWFNPRSGFRSGMGALWVDKNKVLRKVTEYRNPYKKRKEKRK